MRMSRKMLWGAVVAMSLAACGGPATIDEPTVTPTPTDDGLISEAEAIEIGLKYLGLPQPEQEVVEAPSSAKARLMPERDWYAIQGGMPADVGDGMVWVVEGIGKWRDAFPRPTPIPDELRTTYRYGAVAIRADSGRFIGSHQSNTPALDITEVAPPTPTLTPTATS